MHAVVDSPLGPLRVTCSDGAVVGIDYLPRKTRAPKPASPLLDHVAAQLAAYFRDPATGFDLPLVPKGTVFQQRVWQALRDIPAGTTRSYGELSRELGTSARAVGGACAANPIPIVIPCHRVVSARGVGGYDGHTSGPVLARKIWLLEHEGVRCASTI
ncbi:MAG: methylated-DNA--[protein]-cysteine S-methyltransferase [Chromatiales bacterium]|nr:methylated-DNA--[protein]-cysteine S-methyltransferase [Chromatiales bacterium]MDX9767244.1 methylated-DNA--[protein]-cysteine S-methyltransferase [Ectothiorhodospiraceae bacterium]